MGDGTRQRGAVSYTHLDVYKRQVWYNAKGKQIPEDADLAGKEYKEIRHFDELVPYIRSLSQG